MRLDICSIGTKSNHAPSRSLEPGSGPSLRNSGTRPRTLLTRARIRDSGPTGFNRFEREGALSLDPEREGGPALTLPPGPETGLDGTQMTCPLSQKERGNLFSAYWYKIQLTRGLQTRGRDGTSLTWFTGQAYGTTRFQKPRSQGPNETGPP